jgi:hypothetical protein
MNSEMEADLDERVTSNLIEVRIVLFGCQCATRVELCLAKARAHVSHTLPSFLLLGIVNKY